MQENPTVNWQHTQKILFHGSAYPKEISQQCTTATHTEAVHCQRVFHPWLWPLNAPGCTLGRALASKRNFSTYSQCEWIMYKSTPGIMLIQSMYHTWGLGVDCEAEFIGKTNKQTNSLTHSQTYIHSTLCISGTDWWCRFSNHTEKVPTSTNSFQTDNSLCWKLCKITLFWLNFVSRRITR